MFLTHLSRLFVPKRLTRLTFHLKEAFLSISPSNHSNIIMTSTIDGDKIVNAEEAMAKVAVDLSSMRQPYKSDTDVLLESDLPTKDPVKLFDFWFKQAKECGAIFEVNAVCLATSNKNNEPSARMVLLKAFGSDGFRVFTNYNSRKGKDISENPNVALLFYWDPMNRQVRIEGRAEKLSVEEAKEYFEKRRPKKSQLAGAISEQSSMIDSRQTMIAKYNELEEQHANDPFVPKPENWGGYLIVPKKFEFWQGQSSRLHDRIVFEKVESGQEVDNVLIKRAEGDWIMKRLQP